MELSGGMSSGTRSRAFFDVFGEGTELGKGEPCRGGGGVVSKGRSNTILLYPYI